eukprot:TRINITY_DN6667_c0_g1_i1.p1 TRINITY_DN6667_c0_g1~~TRINITY_DN6667_c0_g1_i1.p1  ORF type:complete len:214 (-),score=23.82 TRINITY_DN6667_c0_g1_i1:190-831(-)
MRCVNALVSKGMEPLSKLDLIEKHILPLLSKLNPSTSEDCLRETASLIGKLGLFYLDCATTNKELPSEVKTKAEPAFFNILKLAYQYFSMIPIDVAGSLVQLFTHYINAFKHIEFREIHKNSIDELMQLLVNRMQYSDATIPITESATQLYRKEINSIICHLLAVPLLQQELVHFVGRLAASLKAQYAQFTLTQKLIVLYLFLKIGENIKGSL